MDTSSKEMEDWVRETGWNGIVWWAHPEGTHAIAALSPLESRL